MRAKWGIISNHTGTINMKCDCPRCIVNSSVSSVHPSSLPCYIHCLALWIKDLLKANAEFQSSVMLYFGLIESKVVVEQTP